MRNVSDAHLDNFHSFLEILKKELGKFKISHIKGMSI